MDVKELYRRGTAVFGDLVHGVPEGTWRWPTPCEAWDVRALVNHLVAECRWVAPLLAGATVEEVGDRFDGDLLGDDPAAAWDAASAEALAAVDAVDPTATVHLSFGDVPAGEYLHQLAADHVVHGWDLARATGQDEDLDPGAVGAVLAWFVDREDAYRAGGVVGPAADVPGGAGERDELVARFGRDPSPDGALAAVVRFNLAFGAGDLEAIAAACTDDCLFVDTTPPGGLAHEGAAAVAEAFRGVIASPGAAFETEEGFVAGDRAVFRWRYGWDGGHVRGVDVFRVRDGKVAEKLSYVKG